MRKCVSGNVISPWNTREFNFLEIRGKKKNFVDLFLYGIITRWIHCFRLRRNIFALTCDPKCVGKKKEGGKNILDGEKEKRKKSKYKNIQEKEGLIFFFSVREGVGTRCFLHSDVHAA